MRFIELRKKVLRDITVKYVYATAVFTTKNFVCDQALLEEVRSQRGLPDIQRRKKHLKCRNARNMKLPNYLNVIGHEDRFS